MEFKEFILNENKNYFGEKLGNILNALHDLIEDGKSMGVRNFSKQSEIIVSQIRSILHSGWSKSEEKYLKKLQKIGVAIMKSIEEKNNLEEVLQSSAHELEKILSDLGVPIQNITNQ